MKLKTSTTFLLLVFIACFTAVSILYFGRHVTEDIEDSWTSDYIGKTKQIQESGNYKTALRRYIWYNDHASQYNPSKQYGYQACALSNWTELGQKYPPAIKSMKEVRDQKQKKVLLLDSKDSWAHESLFDNIVLLNEYLKEDERSLELFKKLEALRGSNNLLPYPTFYVIKDLAFEKKEFELINRYIINIEEEYRDTLETYFDMAYSRYFEKFEECNEMYSSDIQLRKAKFKEKSENLILLSEFNGNKEMAEKISDKVSKVLSAKDDELILMAEEIDQYDAAREIRFKYHEETKQIQNSGNYKTALNRHVWFFNNALPTNAFIFYMVVGKQNWVDVFDLDLQNWVDLGKLYPPAMEKLIDTRNEEEKKVLDGKDHNWCALCLKIKMINSQSGQNKKTLDFFKKLKARSGKEKITEDFWWSIKPIAYELKDYELLNDQHTNLEGEYWKFCIDYLSYDAYLEHEYLHNNVTNFKQKLREESEHLVLYAEFKGDKDLVKKIKGNVSNVMLAKDDELINLLVRNDCEDFAVINRNSTSAKVLNTNATMIE